MKPLHLQTIQLSYDVAETFDRTKTFVRLNTNIECRGDDNSRHSMDVFQNKEIDFYIRRIEDIVSGLIYDEN